MVPSSSGKTANARKSILSINNYILFVSEESEIADHCRLYMLAHHWSAKWSLLRGRGQNSISTTARQRMLQPTKVASGARKTGGNCSGYLGNNTFNPVKSVVGYLVTHMLKVSVTYLSSTSIYLHPVVRIGLGFLRVQKKNCFFCEFKLHLGLSSCTNPWNSSRKSWNLSWLWM